MIVCPNIVQKTLMFPSLHRNLVTRAAPHSYVMFALGRKHGVALNSYNILSSHTVNQYIYIGHLVSVDTLSCTVPPPSKCSTDARVTMVGLMK